MWICPKCGRSFKRVGQDHYCGRPPASIEEYILAQPQEIRQRLFQVDGEIKKALPSAKRKIAWSMPTYWDGENLVQFAAFKNHIGLYVGSEAVEEFAPSLDGYKYNKGTIQLPHEKPLPLDLIYSIALWRGERLQKAANSNPVNK